MSTNTTSDDVITPLRLDGDSARSHTRRRVPTDGNSHISVHENSVAEQSSLDQISYEVVPCRDDDADVEAHRISNNYLFGFKKWKSHVTSRPLSERSDVVKELYSDITKIKPVKVSTIRPTNIIYVVVCGWWLALLYFIVGTLMFITILGRHYRLYCWKLSLYFLWPFGKFVHQVFPVPLDKAAYTRGSPKGSPNGQPPGSAESEGGVGDGDSAGGSTGGSMGASCSVDEETALLGEPTHRKLPVLTKAYWKKPQTYLWMILGVPILAIAHFIIIFITWLFVITIPIAKVNFKAVRKILFLNPESVRVGDSSLPTLDLKNLHSEIIMYTHQSMNFYYYKYTVDGMNVILVNLLFFVVLAVSIGYGDQEGVYVDSVTKCILALLAICPLTYYIGQAIASISAQSVLAVGAILNATFGSMVELILYVIALNKGKTQGGTSCYAELVKSAMAGTLLATMLFIPGMCMVVGGLKFRTQAFNPRSAGVSASLLFVCVAGVFSPTIFSNVYGTLSCKKCEQYVTADIITNGSQPGNASSNSSVGLQCSDCTKSIFGLDGDNSLYDDHIKPLVYAIALMLPISYIIGLVFTLKTHTTHLYDNFYEQLDPEERKQHCHMHGTAQWSRLKCIIILLISATLISLCADLVTENIQPLMQQSGISEYFIGVTLLAVIPELPELVNGIQFSLQNNISLGLEVGSSTAVQVCLLQVPIMILINLIYPLNFYLVFSEVHLWAVVFSVLVMNYTFIDGKSNYFQGTVLVGVYLILMVMYFFSPVPDIAKCS